MDKTRDKTAAIVVAGGQGIRAGVDSASHLPKQYQLLAGKPVIAWSLETLLRHPNIDIVVPVIAKDALEIYSSTLNLLGHPKLREPIFGGATRQQSVRNGLAAFASKGVKNVLIHDAARPFVSTRIIDDILSALKTSAGAVTGIPQTDTLKQSSEDADIIEKNIDRRKIWSVQTPQGFDYDTINRLHEKFKLMKLTDDTSLYEHAGLPVALCTGDRRNFKITHPEDFELAELLMKKTNFEFRTGQGLDVHRFQPGNSITLCGIKISHTHGLKGHSDADVAMHALTDAVLGAIGKGDIGTHFPPSENQWKDASSQIFLERACDLVQLQNGFITNCDITIICELPKITPHRNAMRQKLAEIIKISKDRVSVKATTTEGLGFSGRQEGISAVATATVKLPEPFCDE